MTLQETLSLLQNTFLSSFQLVSDSAFFYLNCFLLLNTTFKSYLFSQSLAVFLFRKKPHIYERIFSSYIMKRIFPPRYVPLKVLARNCVTLHFSREAYFGKPTCVKKKWKIFCVKPTKGFFSFDWGWGRGEAMLVAVLRRRKEGILRKHCFGFTLFCAKLKWGKAKWQAGCIYMCIYILYVQASLHFSRGRIQVIFR